LIAAPAGVRDADVAAIGSDADAAVAELRRRGHVVQHTGGRMRLACAPQHFDPRRFEAARCSALGTALEIWESVESTNDLARAAGAAGAAAPDQVWLAESQTGGRGRQGRTWTCAAHAGLLFSFIVPGPLAAAAGATWLPLAVGLGVAEALRTTTGDDIRTKWPNDLLRGGRKLGGILIEARTGSAGFAVVGVGLNCDPAATARADLPGATALASGIGREVLLAAILAGIEARLGDWRAQRWSRLHAAWTALDCVVGARVRVATAAEVLAGRAATLTGDGLLRLELDDGTARDIAAGEVHLL